MVAVPDEPCRRSRAARRSSSREGEPNTFAKRAVTVGPSVGGLVPISEAWSRARSLSGCWNVHSEGRTGQGASAAHEH